jgi:hypothetical protein
MPIAPGGTRDPSPIFILILPYFLYIQKSKQNPDAATGQVDKIILNKTVLLQCF